MAKTTRTTSTTTAEIEGLRAEIARRRASTHARAPLPGELWARAVSVARGVGAYAAARDLGVSYESLRTRLDEADRGALVPASGFVEVSGAQLLATAREPGGTVVELRAPNGVAVTVRLAAGVSVDVVGLARALGGGRP
jgi:hypothetical protein